MASSYSTDLKLELMVTGENAGTWGDKTNTNLNLVQQAIAGFEQVTLSSGGTVALVMSDGALSNARNLEEAGRNLYNFMRLADEIVLGRTNPIKKSIAVAPIPNTGLGISINDRLARASSNKL